jgi:HSP20 family molecular chaperone IbpA
VGRDAERFRQDDQDCDSIDRQPRFRVPDFRQTIRIRAGRIAGTLAGRGARSGLPGDERSAFRKESLPCLVQSLHSTPWAAGPRNGFIRTESIRLPSADRRRAPSGRSGETEEPGVTLWAGPKALIINAVFPGIDLENLRIGITGTRLVFSGFQRPNPASRGKGPRRPQSSPLYFSHFVELPYAVDADRAEVRKENGLISIILKKDESLARNGSARLESSIMNSMRRYFGENGRSADPREDEDRILQSLKKYFAYIGVKDAVYPGAPR